MREDPSVELTSRRRFLAALGMGTAATTAAACSDGRTSSDESSSSTSTAGTPVAEPLDVPADPGIGTEPFTIGVASGDPLPDAVMLWTRLAPQPESDDGGMPAGDVDVLWEVAVDDSFDTVVSSGIAPAATDAAHAVRVDATGLKAATWYHYRFRIGEWTSPVGRTRTAPRPGSEEPVDFGFASCQSFQSGWYNAWRDVADADLDLVVFLGDYIYENGSQTVDPAEGVVRPMGVGNDLPECTTLAEYRRRYAVYRGDENLRAAHAAAPWLVVWDDHEVDNNYAGAESSKDGVEPEEFSQRRAAAYRAWWESMPVRLPPPEGPDLEIDRRIEWGSLASFFLIDTRQFRADQACGDATLDLGPACDEVTDPDRQFLGAAQEARLIEGLTSSESTWNVIGNQTVMSPLVVGDAILNYDQWDGYPVARERLLTAIEDAGLTNTVVITGDIHVAGVGDVQLGEGDDARTVATELVGTSISSDAPIPEDLTDLVSTLLPWIQYFDARRGWTRCSVGPDEWTAEYRVVDDNLIQDQPVAIDATFTIKPDTPGAVPA